MCFNQIAQIGSQNNLFYQINHSYFRVEGESVEEATYGKFKVGDRFILSDLEEFCRRFGLELNFVSYRNA